MIDQSRIDDLRARYRVSDVAARRTKLRKAGGEFVGLCPFHKERSPSFYVNDVKAFYHCFGCGAHGDIISFVQETERLSFPDAVAAIDGAGLPPVDPAWLATAKVEGVARDNENLETAQRFWEGGCAIDQTPAEQYLLSRNIRVRPPSLRFGIVPSWRDDEGRWRGVRPCLMLGASTPRGEFAGIQRIFLTQDGHKADMERPKLTLGRIRMAGGFVMFGRPSPDAIACGSPEDGLTLFQRYNEMVPVLVSCGESNLPFLNLPRWSKRIIVARQNDKPGMEAQRKAIAAFKAQGRETFPAAPKPEFKDWNDEECGVRMRIAA